MDSHSPISNQPLSAPWQAAPDWQNVLKNSDGLPVVTLGNGQTLFLARWILPVRQAPIENGFLIAENGHIQALGQVSDLPASWQSALERQIHLADKQGWLLSPGLINAHIHLEQSIGAVSPMPDVRQPDMAAWLINVKPAVTRLMEDGDYRIQALQRGIRELISSGTTCVNDISRQGESLAALQQANLRGAVSLEFFHPNTETLNEAILTPVLDRYRALRAQYAAHPFLRVGLSPHSPYNVSPIAWQWVLDKLAEDSLNTHILHTHLAECLAEHEYLAGRPSRIPDIHNAYIGKTFTVANPKSSPARYLQEHGLLTPNLIAAHGVHLDEADLKALNEASVHVAHCPRSNAYLQGTTIPSYAAYKNAGLHIGLGTDGHLSTPGLDIREEARIARIYHYLDAADTLRLLTVQGAQVLNLSETIGALKEGYDADMALWRPSPNEQSRPPEEQLLSPHTDCHGVWVRGEQSRAV